MIEKFFFLQIHAERSIYLLLICKANFEVSRTVKKINEKFFNHSNSFIFENRQKIEITFFSFTQQIRYYLMT